MGTAHDEDTKQAESRNVGRLITILDVLSKASRNGLRLVDGSDHSPLFAAHSGESGGEDQR